MRLFYVDSNYPVIGEEMIRKAYHISQEHPIPMGSAGAFGFELGYILVSDPLWSAIRNNPRLGLECADFCRRFHLEDYGEVSSEDQENNDEARWISGCSYEMIGCYQPKTAKRRIWLDTGWGAPLFYWENEEIPEEWKALSHRLRCFRRWQDGNEFLKETYSVRNAWLDTYKRLKKRLPSYLVLLIMRWKMARGKIG